MFSLLQISTLPLSNSKTFSRFKRNSIEFSGCPVVRSPHSFTAKGLVQSLIRSKMHQAAGFSQKKKETPYLTDVPRPFSRPFVFQPPMHCPCAACSGLLWRARMSTWRGMCWPEVPWLPKNDLMAAYTVLSLFIHQVVVISIAFT